MLEELQAINVEGEDWVGGATGSETVIIGTFVMVGT